MFKTFALIVLIFLNTFFFKVLAQIIDIHSTFFENFNTSSVVLKLDDYGNKYLMIGHNSDLIFSNDTVFGPASSLNKMDPNGNLIWSSKPIKGNFSANILAIENDELVVFGSFRDSLIWQNFTISTDFTNNPFQRQSAMAVFSLDGSLITLKKLPMLKNFRVCSFDEKYLITGDFDSILQFGSTVLLENPNSLQLEAGDIFLGAIDSVGNPLWAINIGGPSFEVVNDVLYNERNGEILVHGFYVEPPTVDPIWPQFTYLFLSFDSLQNLTNSRSYVLDFSNNFFVTSDDRGSIIFKEFNDSSGTIFPADITYSGIEYVGYYIFETGVFNPPSFGVAFGGDTFGSIPTMGGRLEFDVENGLVSDFLSHPSGMKTGANEFQSAPFSVTGFDIDSVNLKWSIPSNVEFQMHGFSNGIQSISRNFRFSDSLVSIDTLHFIKDIFKNEHLFIDIIDCDYFKKELFINRQLDSLQIQNSVLDIQWYLNNQAIPGATSNKIRLIGSGNYHAELSNYYGCVDYSDTISVVSGIGEETYNSLKIYPNPGRGQINFEFTEQAQGNLQLFDIRGMVIKSIEINSKSLILDVSAWNEGVYIYKIETNSGVLNGKIVVK